MFAQAMLQQLEYALGKCHPDPGATLDDRAQFIGQAIQQMKESPDLFATWLFRTASGLDTAGASEYEMFENLHTIYAGSGSREPLDAGIVADDLTIAIERLLAFNRNMVVEMLTALIHTARKEPV